MKYIRRTLKLFALSSIALTGIMCSEKSNTESGADTYFATHFQDDNKCPISEAALNVCRMERNACAFPTGKYKESYTDEELANIKACYEQYRSCRFELSDCGPLKTLKAFVLDTLTDGKELGEISPELAWDGRGDMGGVETADRRCQALANKNKITGKFKAFLSSDKRDFYKEINPKYLDIPFENVHGTVLTGNVVTLNDIRNPEKNTNDGMWDTIMFFKANKERFRHLEPNCNFRTALTFDLYTGMWINGDPWRGANCNNWTSNHDENGIGYLTIFFDRDGSSDPIEPVTQTRWEKCLDNGIYSEAIHQGNNNILGSYLIRALSVSGCDLQSDGLFCVQVEK